SEQMSTCQAQTLGICPGPELGAVVSNRKLLYEALTVSTGQRPEKNGCTKGREEGYPLQARAELVSQHQLARPSFLAACQRGWGFLQSLVLSVIQQASNSVAWDCPAAEDSGKC
ncbi:hypothetical protein P7K49_028581, partial [Saguinus oedipus]